MCLFKLYPVLSKRTDSTFSLIQAVKGKGHTLVNVSTKIGASIVLRWIKAQLIEVFSFTGAMGVTSEYQIKALAKHIYRIYYYLTFNELTYFFEAFENGMYGPFYVGKTVNAQNLMDAMRKFEYEVLEERGHVEDEEKEKNEKKEELKNRNKPTGYEAWLLYCKESNRKNTELPNIRMQQ